VIKSVVEREREREILTFDAITVYVILHIYILNTVQRFRNFKKKEERKDSSYLHI
jgi:hypothetical protein